ncbi:MAG TPA: NlpC/P60 family protein [Streptosporangiaceae bacterium]|nr:NlpC/P60 family protein [Streptosporangiaceae bacterium]
MLRLPLLVVLAAGVLTAAVMLIAVGAGLTGPTAGACAPAVPVGSAAASGVSLGAGQLANARIIYAVGAGRGLPLRAEVVAIATAMQESGLRDLPYGSADSLGLFQQRPSQGWGTVAQIMDPVTAARAFYDRLIQVRGWQALPVTAAAQAVQRSGFPGAYAQWQPVATRLAASFADTASTSCAVLDANIVPAAVSAALPPHYQLPAATAVTVALAIRFALAQLGTSYQSGGSCTDARSADPALHCDSSSLVQQAYRAGGIPLPRTTDAQVGVGVPVYALSALSPGDLVFTAGADGTSGHPGHVGMYIGAGLIVQAPQAGEDVQLSPLSSWASQIVAMRRLA